MVEGNNCEGRSCEENSGLWGRDMQGLKWLVRFSTKPKIKMLALILTVALRFGSVKLKSLSHASKKTLNLPAAN